MADVRLFIDCETHLGESPLWDMAEQRLYWLDSLGGDIRRCAVDGSDLQHWKMPAAIGSIALRQGGGALVALETGLHFFDFDSGELEFIAHPEQGLADVRLNDGAIDSRGRLVTGSLDMGTIYDPIETRKPRGSLWRLDADRSVHLLESGISVANGPCWSPDQLKFYFTDTNLQTIFVYDWDEESGTPSNRRPFVAGTATDLPDGCTVDAEGYVWSVFNGAYTGNGQVRRFTPDGILDRTIAMPTRFL